MEAAIVAPAGHAMLFPDDFARLFSKYGFDIVERWGRYAGEVYGMGPELVIQANPETKQAREAYRMTAQGRANSIQRCLA